MAKRKASKGPGLNWLWWPVWILLAVVPPFFLLVRGSVLLYDLLALSAWQALGASALLTFAFLFFYLNWLAKRLHRRKKAQEKTRRFSWRAAWAVASARSSLDSKSTRGSGVPGALPRARVQRT